MVFLFASFFEYECFAVIPVKVLVANDWKKLCEKEHLKLKNEDEIKDIERKKLNKIKEEKEELERFLELKKKYGVINKED